MAENSCGYTGTFCLVQIIFTTSGPICFLEYDKNCLYYEKILPTRQVFLIRYVECKTAPITSAMINCPIHIKTHKLWKLCDLSISIFCHVNTCHGKDLGFKTQIYEEIESTSHILALFCYNLTHTADFVLSHEKTVTTNIMIVMMREKCFVQTKNSYNRR